MLYVNIATPARWNRREIHAIDLDLDVIRLIRVRLGPLNLDDLKVGQWRMLTNDEMVELLSLKRMT